jgi:prepilin-type N-terminal cleavage/methylation domain-containing protein
MRRKAFTLVELLVVISIIAVLLAVLMPALNKARDSGRIVMCKSNMHQYSLGLAMYLNENNNNFPCAFESFYKASSGTDEHPLKCRWHDRLASNKAKPENASGLWKYLAAADAHLCQTFAIVAKVKTDPKNAHAYGHNPDIPIDPQYSYSQNAFLGIVSDQLRGTYGFSQIRDAVATLSRVVVPSKTFAFAEENPWMRNVNVKNDPAGTGGFNDNALVTSWSISVAQDQVMKYVNAGRLTANPDRIASFHKTKGNNVFSGNGNAAMVDGSIAELNWANTLYYAWPHKK